MAMRPFFRALFGTRKVPDSALAVGRSSTDQGGIYDGTVGWGDGQPHYDIDEKSGVTLVRVTLFKGRNPDQDGAVTDNLAHGHQILCRIGAPLSNIPPLNAQVVVAMPADRMLTPGAGVIFSMPVKSPGTQFGPDRAKLDFGPDFDLILKARSVTITDYEDRYISVGPKFGIKMGDADGNGCQMKDAQWLLYTIHDGNAATTLMLSRDNGIALLHDDGKKTAIKMSGGVWQGIGDSFYATFGAGYLGVSAALPTPIAYFGPGLASLVSTSWFVSPN